MYHSVSAGFSARSPSLAAWRTHTPENLQKTMMLNGSIDPAVMKALAQARSEGSYSTQEYVAGLVTLANNITHALEDSPKSMELYLRAEGYGLSAIQAALGHTVLAISTGVTGGLSAIEAIVALEGHNTVAHLAASIASAVAAIIIRKKGHPLVDKVTA